MYTGYIVRKNETAEDARIRQAIINLGMSGEDVICIADDGYVSELETLQSAKIAANDNTLETVEAAMAALLAKLNAPDETAEG